MYIFAKQDSLEIMYFSIHILLEIIYEYSDKLKFANNEYN